MGPSIETYLRPGLEVLGQATEGCNGCHRAAQRGFIVMQRPTAEPWSNQTGSLELVRYRIAADAVLLAHFLFAAFAVFGCIMVAFDFWWAWLHVPTVLWSALVNLMGWSCPLTPLENRLRVLSGQSGYVSGFIQHYVGRAVYPRGMPRRLELMAGFSVLAGNALVYTVLLVFDFGAPISRSAD